MHGKAQLCIARQGTRIKTISFNHGTVMHGRAQHSKAQLSNARHSKIIIFGAAWLSWANRSSAKHGSAGPCRARPGKAIEHHTDFIERR